MSDDATVSDEASTMGTTKDSSQLSDLVVVANRGPVNLHRAADGTLVAGHGSGGLAPSLAKALEGRGALWVAAALSDDERELARGAALGQATSSVQLEFIDFAPEVIDAAYNTVANRTLWYLHHGMFDHVHQPLFDHVWWEAWQHYRAYNVAFAERVAARAAVGATVMVNDYHLSLVGTELARLRPDLLSVHFTHTPFATPEELSILPDSVRDELLRGLASYGAVGFHAARWMDRYVDSFAGLVDGPPHAFVAPLGSDARELRALRDSSEVQAATQAICARYVGKRLIVRSDRIEPSKNILRGIAAFAELLELHPQLIADVRFVMRVYASRTSVKEYVRYGDEMRALVEDVNRRFGDAAGEDVIELDTGDDFAASVAALSVADVIFVNPIRDGMNLVAKEGPIVNDNDGVLVLSREAGAYAELGAAALGVHPFDVSATAEALLSAVEMPQAERKGRAAELKRAAAALPPSAWLDAVLGEARPVGHLS